MSQIAFPEPLLIHLGCNETKLRQWVNVDTRKTTATDLVHDCSNLAPFADASARAIFSHAFFEHLTMRGRAHLLADVRRVLRPDGFVYFCGLPDFAVIARSYLEGRPGNVSPTFDLHEVYRYTHGDPEGQPDWYFEQLHKTLFDVRAVRRMLADAGFQDVLIYRYAFGNEPNPVNLGFIAWTTPRPQRDAEARAIVNDFAAINRLNAASVQWDLQS